MTLLQLRYYQSACRMNSISQAAKLLHVTQPSISTAIKNLETEFGVTLIHHQRNTFALTEDGETFLAMVDDLLENANHLVTVMNDIGQSRHSIRLGIPPMTGNFLFPKIYTEFYTLYPDIHIIPKEAGKKELLMDIDKNLLDIAFIPHKDSIPPTYHHVKIMDTETVCCISEKNSLSAKECITIFDLIDQPLVMFQNSFFHNDLITQRFLEHDIVPTILHQSNQLSTIQTLIEKNVGIGFLFKDIAQSLSNIKMVSLDPPLKLSISLIWRKDIQKNDDITRFTDYFKVI